MKALVTGGGGFLGKAIVKLLLEKGADTKLANSSGRTAKDIAESEGFTSIATLLQGN